MKILSLILTLLGSMWLLTPAAPVHAADKQVSGFLEQDQLQFGMDLAEAQQRVADEKKWEIAYRIDTPSTNDIACRYNLDVMYLAQFYQGRCYSLEKRAVVTKDEALAIFTYYTELLGPTPEITNSRDEKLLFGRWTLKDREIELTAYEHHTGEYMAIYTEYDPLAKGEAVYARDNEIASQPMTVDPITGQAVPIKPGADEDGANQPAPDAASQEGGSASEPGPAEDGKGGADQAGKAQEDPPASPPSDDGWLEG